MINGLEIDEIEETQFLGVTLTINFRCFFGHLKNAILANSSHLYIPMLASFTTFNIYNIYVDNVYWGFR